MCATVQPELQDSNTLPASAPTPLGPVQQPGTGHSGAYLMIAVDVQPNGTVSTTHCICHAQIQTPLYGDSGTSNTESWGGCAVFCVFSSLILSFFLSFFNGALSLEWTIACLERSQT